MRLQNRVLSIECTKLQRMPALSCVRADVSKNGAVNDLAISPVKTRPYLADHSQFDVESDVSCGTGR